MIEGPLALWPPAPFPVVSPGGFAVGFRFLMQRPVLAAQAGEGRIALASRQRLASLRVVLEAVGLAMHALVQNRSFERQLYLGASAIFLALVFWAFAHSYYLRFLFDRPPLSARLHVHGVVMSGWVILLVVQSSLIAAHQVRWHRRLGAIGAGWAVLVVILGSVTTVHAATREVGAHSEFAPMQVMIMWLELAQMALFAGFVTAAVLMRHRTDYHKRLMLLTIACMLPSALARLPVSFMSNEVILAGLNLFVILCVGLDTLRFRRLHPGFGWGAAVLLLALNGAFYFAHTPALIALGSRLVSS